MKTKILLGSLMLGVTLSSSTMANDGITANNVKVSKVASTILEMYMIEVGCNGVEAVEVVGALPSETIDGQKALKEHWKVKGCNSTHDLEMSFFDNGNDIQIRKL